jgi:hypothetical protein
MGSTEAGAATRDRVGKAGASAAWATCAPAKRGSIKPVEAGDEVTGGRGGGDCVTGGGGGDLGAGVENGCGGGARAAGAVGVGRDRVDMGRLGATGGVVTLANSVNVECEGTKRV